MSEIRLEGIVKCYGDTTVIAGLDLHVRHGEFFTLLGPSGCGKTTLLRMIAGFIVPDGGRLLLDDEDITRLPAYKRGTGMVFQDYALFPDKTVFDNVAYGLRVRKLSRPDIEQKVRHMLERVELDHLAARYPGELSGGQRQRVALARALVIEPRVLLMDEPLSNLDAKLRIQMRDVIRELQQEASITAIFVTHDQEEALSMSDRIALLNKGHIEQLDTPEGLYATPVSAYAADFIGAANLIDVSDVGLQDGKLMGTVHGHRLLLPGTVPEGPCQLATRPEQVQLYFGMSSRAESLPATVVRRRYLGHKISYGLRLPGGQIIGVDIPADSTRTAEIGDTVHVGFGPGSRLVRR